MRGWRRIGVRLSRLALGGARQVGVAAPPASATPQPVTGLFYDVNGVQTALTYGDSDTLFDAPPGTVFLEYLGQYGFVQLTFFPPDGEQFVVGTTYEALSTDPNQGAGMSVTAPYCNTVPSGRFTVDDLAFGPSGAASRASIRYQADCLGY